MNTLAALAMLWLVAATAAAEQKIKLSDLPAAVKATIDKQSAGGTVTRIEKATQGTTVSYEVGLKKNGKNSEFTVNADGSLHK